MSAPLLSAAPRLDAEAHRPALEIERVFEGTALDAADGLLRDYSRHLLRAYHDRPELAALIADETSWRAANGALRLAYLPPRGTLLVACLDGEPAGCIALRPAATARAGEIKRLFVRDAVRGHGIARALLAAAEQAARRLGYRRLLLETGDRMTAAQQLYLAWGFVPTPPYRALPPSVAPHFQAMALSLA